MPKIRIGAQPDEVKEDKVHEVPQKGSDITVARARDLSFQQRATEPDPVGASGMGIDIFSQLIKAGELVSPWWSTRRDMDLRNFWKQSDHLSGAMYVTNGKIATMRFKVRPRDRSVHSQVRMAEEAEQILWETPEYGKGWEVFITKWLEDLQGQDNGAFAEIIGHGRPDQPRIGKPVSLAHLDSSRCVRSSDPLYPVIYQDTDGKRYKLHYTRVLYASQMPSAAVEMHDVGFSAVSRAINTTQNLIDISRFKQEKLGSRPPRILLVGSGISAQEILMAFARSEEMDDNAGLSRYRRIVALAAKQGRGDVSIDTIDLASVPDGFDEETSTTLGMFAIALAFGIDARELWPATVSGATKADAVIQHLKARGRGVGQTLQIIERQINQKLLPPSLEFKFDLQDDEQDALVAEIRDQRSIRHERDVNDSVLTLRVVREQMLDDSDITREQFIELELEDGRLEDGTDVIALFTSDHPEIKAHLVINIDRPLEYNGTDAEERQDAVIRAIDKSILRVQGEVLRLGWGTQKKRARQALAALERLKELWEGEEEEIEEEVEVTDADRERIRNEDDYRGDAEITAVRQAIGKK